ncbi:MAG: peptidoglycan DD-metalloendopeptidase family protein, partial [Bacteroidota bacterium]|nr:peptidoglycan DD-metalloendopeptidase family protein [Bacteroidota bacterium]
VRYMKAGHRWWLASETVRDSMGSEARLVPKWFVYERNPKDYALFSLGDTLGVRLDSYPVDTVYARAQGTIENSLYMDFDKVGHPTNLAVAMASVYAWTIDFSRVQKGDTYDVTYRREVVNGTPAGMPVVLSSVFTHWDRPLEAYRFETDGVGGYFDLEGGSLQKVFLKAPVEFSRISSRYNPKRFHPVLKKVKGHFGTDYAAPKGTPIVAVGDGVVTKSSYTSGNGKYVKIRHNSTYETQYLHMSKRAVKEGQRVKQGQTIGYVGQTGLATGPHVCFRFWKNGKQIDHLREEFPPSDPIDATLQKAFANEVTQLEALKERLEPNAGPFSPDGLR